MFGFPACQEELAGCSPMSAMLSPPMCESAHLERATKYPVSVGAAQRPSTVGCKRKAGCDHDTPNSTAAHLVDCLTQSGRPSREGPLQARWECEALPHHQVKAHCLTLLLPGTAHLFSLFLLCINAYHVVDLHP
jgi:hypothetical protein